MERGREEKKEKEDEEEEGRGGIMGWLAPVGGDLLPSQRKEGTADATFSPKPAPAPAPAAVVGRQWGFRFMFRFV